MVIRAFPLPTRAAAMFGTVKSTPVWRVWFGRMDKVGLCGIFINNLSTAYVIAYFINNKYMLKYFSDALHAGCPWNEDATVSVKYIS